MKAGGGVAVVLIGIVLVIGAAKGTWRNIWDAALGKPTGQGSGGPNKPNAVGAGDTGSGLSGGGAGSGPSAPGPSGFPDIGQLPGWVTGNPAGELQGLGIGGGGGTAGADGTSGGFSWAPPAVDVQNVMAQRGIW